MVGKEATTVVVRHGHGRHMRQQRAIVARRWYALFAVAVSSIVFCMYEVGAESKDSPIRASGNTVYRWMIGSAQASLLEGDCVLQHEGLSIESNAILMISDGPRGNVRTRIVIDGMKSADGRPRVEPTSLTLNTIDDPQIQSPRFRGEPTTPPALLKYLNTAPESVAGNASGDGVRPVQFQEPIPAPVPDAPVLTPAQGTDLSTVPPPPTVFPDGATTGGSMFFVGGGNRSVEFLARGASMPPEITLTNRPESGETVVVARGGVTVLVRDVSMRLRDGQVMELGTISLSADRIVAWLPTVADIFRGETDFSQADGEIYLEGDIVFRQGDRIIYAERMYYNVAQEKGVVLDAEAVTSIPEYQGIVRLKADVLQQVASGNFIAFDAAVTTSRLGVPQYWLQSERLTLQDRTRTAADIVTGQPVLVRDPFASSENNFLYFCNVPILYWPRFSTSLENPSYYIRSIKSTSDRAFGTGILIDWDLFQLFGFENVPKGVSWELSTDYLSDRGPALGTMLEYRLPGLFGIPGPVNGFFDAWVIDDDGLDRLGNDRIDLPPETRTRGRSLLRHRHYLPNDWEFIAELGWISDRNFLEQYLEREWDQDPDQNTALRLRKYNHNNLFDLTANAQINEFFTETENLPVFDHYLLGGSIFDLLTWSAHNRVGYQKMNVADAPTNADEAAQQSPIPGEFNREGLVASTRQELALPVGAGPFKFVPFVSGEAAYYGEAVDRESLTRLLGQAGVRASLPMSRVDPTIQSSLMNVRGLAHKVEWTAEYFYADSNTGLDELPLYDALDDNAQEQFRRRFIQDTFGGAPLPVPFDPRNYAYRQGMQRWVASPSDTIADDLQQLRMGVHQRFQTKRGLPGRERIVDLFQFDVDTALFPEADRDNFGQTLGPTTYDMRYHIGDRFTLQSDGYFDFFSGGLRSVSAGLRSSRPGVCDWYYGVLSLEGPISSTVFRSSIDYRMNEKWIFSSGWTYDFGQTGNVGQAFGLTRVGESLLVRLGINVDSGRDNVGIGFSVEPRFWPTPRLGRLGGKLIPPPGLEGLE